MCFLTAVLSLCKHQISLCFPPGRKLTSEVRVIGLGDAGGFQHLPCLDDFSPVELICICFLLFIALHFKSNLNLIELPTLCVFLPEIYKLTLSLEARCYLLVSELHSGSGKVCHRSFLPRQFIFILKYTVSWVNISRAWEHWEQHPGQGSFLHPT